MAKKKHSKTFRIWKVKTQMDAKRGGNTETENDKESTPRDERFATPRLSARLGSSSDTETPRSSRNFQSDDEFYATPRNDDSKQDYGASGTSLIRYESKNECAESKSEPKHNQISYHAQPPLQSQHLTLTEMTVFERDGARYEKPQLESSIEYGHDVRHQRVKAHVETPREMDAMVDDIFSYARHNRVEDVSFHAVEACAVVEYRMLACR
jgi:hypothetical protein